MFKSALVLGTGVSGKSAATLLLKNGIGVAIACPGDAAALGGLQECGAEIISGPAVDAVHTFAARHRNRADAAVYLSPGIPLDSPEALECRAAGLAVVGELEAGALFLRSRIVSVTGSKGKSSIVKFIADALSMNGTAALPCANYGIALNEIAAMEYQPQVAVAECSSFQIETIGNSFKPEIGIVLNLSRDHLDRHSTMENYRDIKLRLFRNMSGDALALLPSAAEDPYGLHERFMEMYGRPATLFGYGEDAQWRCVGSSVVNEGLGIVIDASLGYFGNKVLRPSAAAACAALHALGLRPQAIEDALRSFEPLPHRMQFIEVVDGVKFVDDSKATSIEALLAGARMSHPPVYLIAGGRLKEKIAVAGKEVVTSGVKKAYLIGECMDEMESAWAPDLPMERCGTLKEAVASAFKDAAGGGGTVLLSPGTASFDQFKDYKQRGEEFAHLVMAIEKKAATAAGKHDENGGVKI